MTTAPLAGQAPALAAVAVGGALGALGRHGLGLALPHPTGSFPWATFAVNVTGCLLIGVLVVLVTEWREAHPLARPLLGTGVLGGYTTFSTYAVDAHQMLGAGRLVAAGAYVVGTLVAALAATWLGLRLTRLAVGLPR
jgi:CrcB protein